jgi:hypothetical protein
LDLRTSQTSLVHDLFVRTADENYITARWCAVNRLNIDFFWLAVQTLEKYMKAVLLLNGKTSKQFGHEIVKLYAQIRDIAGPLLPNVLVKPQNLEIEDWHECSSESFVEHLQRQGNADNRYLIYGYHTRSQDLYKLDQMVFAVRRLICPLADRAFPSWDPGAPILTHRERLIRDPEDYGRLFMPLDDLICAKENSPTREAALNLNLWFAPRDFTHTPEREGSANRQPVIVRRVLDPLESDDSRAAAQGIQVAQWLLNNVVLPRGVTDCITKAIEAAQIKHGLA